MKITVARPHVDDAKINVHFGRRAGFCLADPEAERLKDELGAIVEDKEYDRPDDDVYVIDGTYGEDHFQVLIGVAWFEITFDEMAALFADLDALL